jgi:hypothetical protein
MNTPSIWNHDSPHKALYDELWSKLVVVPASGPALAPHAELLRSVSRIYYDRFNNGFGNGPFDDEFSIISRHCFELAELMPPGYLNLFINSFEFLDRGEKILRTGKWEADAALESLIGAAILYVAKIEKTYKGPRSVADLLDGLNSNDQEVRTSTKQEAIGFIDNPETPIEMLKAFALSAITRIEENAQENLVNAVSHGKSRAPRPR